MGQAKHRKLNDPLYGKVRQDQHFRGLVLTCPMEITGDRLSVKHSGLHPEELRYSLLFWDELVWPMSRAVMLSGGPEEEFLQKLGVLRRPDHTVHGDVAQGMLTGVLEAHRVLSLEQPGAWALLEGPNSISYPRQSADAVSGLSVELLKCIPVPACDVPYEEILSFKARRRDELLLLRAELERINSNSLLASDPVDFLESAKVAVDKACRDVLAISHEWQFPVALADKRFEFSLDLGKGVANGAAVYKGLEWLGAMPQSAGLLEGLAGMAAVASQFQVSAKPKFLGIRKNLGPYAYTYRLHKELQLF